MTEQQKFDRVILKTENDFWAIVESNYPSCDSDGVVRADVVVNLHTAMKEALAEWIKYNVE